MDTADMPQGFSNQTYYSPGNSPNDMPIPNISPQIIPQGYERQIFNFQTPQDESSSTNQKVWPSNSLSNQPIPNMKAMQLSNAQTANYVSSGLLNIFGKPGVDRTLDVTTRQLLQISTDTASNEMNPFTRLQQMHSQQQQNQHGDQQQQQQQQQSQIQAQASHQLSPQNEQQLKPLRGKNTQHLHTKQQISKQHQLLEDRHRKNNINIVFPSLNGKSVKIAKPNSESDTRYDNTLNALRKAGLLDITMQTGELLKKNNSLQKDIDMLEEIVKVTKHLMTSEN